MVPMPVEPGFYSDGQNMNKKEMRMNTGHDECYGRGNPGAIEWGGLLLVRVVTEGLPEVVTFKS